MSATNGNGRVHLLGHQQPKPTKAQVEQQMAADIQNIAQSAVIPVIEHYMQQIPGLVTHIATQLVAEMCKANGLEFKPPVAPTDSEKPE